MQNGNGSKGTRRWVRVGHSRESDSQARMASGPAQDRCRAKTGTFLLSATAGVTNLSGYCRNRHGRLVAFSILMNDMDIASGRALQDEMVEAIARG